MLDLQSALNVGEGFFYDSEQWMEDEIDGKRRELDARPNWPIYTIEPGQREACIIDPLLGTSTKLFSVLVLNLDNSTHCRRKQLDYFNSHDKLSQPDLIRPRNYYHEDLSFKLSCITSH
jgi:hypothetical protein